MMNILSNIMLLFNKNDEYIKHLLRREATYAQKVSPKNKQYIQRKIITHFHSQF